MLCAVLGAVGLHAKSVKHRALFAIRNTITAFDSQHQIKDDLHDHQKSALKTVEKHRTIINKARQVKAEKKQSNDKVKVIEAADKNKWIVLNLTLLDNIVRCEPDIAKEHPYKSMPATAAQGVIRQVVEDFKSARKGMDAYDKDPSKFTGRPSMPNYTHDEACSFEIPLGNTCNGHLPALGKKKIGIDQQCRKFLTTDQKAEWDKFDLGKEIREVGKRLPKGAKPVLFRVTFSAWDRSVGQI